MNKKSAQRIIPLRDKRGQTLVEFALILPLLFLMLFGLIELSVMFYVNLTMQNAVRQGARTSVVGSSSGGPTQRTALIQAIKDSSNGLYDKDAHGAPQLTTYIVTPGNSTFTNFTGANIGGAGQIVMVRLDYTWPLLTQILSPFFANDEYSFTVKATMRNERFLSSGGG
ncbi:MAG: TadE/TadG family type IV pilus assembly protein [Nitrospirota bacterium]